MAFSPTGQYLATGSMDGTVTLWDTTSWKASATLEARQARSPPWRTSLLLWSSDFFTLADQSANALAFSPDGQTLAVARGRMNPNFFPVGEPRPSVVELWDMGTRKLRATLRGHQASVQAVAFAPDGQTLATTGEDRTVKLWDVVTGKHLTTFRGGTRGGKALAFSADHKWLAALDGDGTIGLWRAATEQELQARRGE
jgi:WD40 repeat protein